MILSTQPPGANEGAGRDVERSFRPPVEVFRPLEETIEIGADGNRFPGRRLRQARDLGVGPVVGEDLLQPGDFREENRIVKRVPM